MGCVVCKPIDSSSESLCLTLFFPSAAAVAGAPASTTAAPASAQPHNPLRPPPAQPGPVRRIITSPVKDSSGWPTWLSAAAGDSLAGWTPRRADSFRKLEKIGSGTYSNVYKAIDLEKGHVVALKKVRVDCAAAIPAAAAGDAISGQAAAAKEAARFMVREIALLRRLGQHPNIVRLEGLVTSRVATSASLYLVFEYMEHDLAGLLAAPGVRFSLPQVKCYMKQLLLGLEHCHNKGVLHRDIKCSNLLLTKEGILKIADFGLASSYEPNQARPMTSQVITLWYRPPELLLGATNYGTGVDLWSVGCILGELLLGRPIFPGRTEVEQLHKIFKLCGTPSEEYFNKLKLPNSTSTFKQYGRCVAETFRDLPQPALNLLETLLSIDPENRGTATDALNNDFFKTEPYACDPSSLPQYPPSKEIDIKLRNQEKKRRERANGSVGYDKINKVHSRNKGHRGLLTPDVNSKTQTKLDGPKLVTSASARGKIEKFPPPHLDAGIGFNLDLSHDESDELFAASVIELKKIHNSKLLHVSSMNHPMRNDSSRRVGSNSRVNNNNNKNKSGLKMAPSSVLIGGFRPYTVGNKARVHVRAKGKDSANLVVK